MKNLLKKYNLIIFIAVFALIITGVFPETLSAQSNAQSTIRYEDNDKALQFVGNWVNNVNSNSSGGSGKYSNTKGDYLKFDFTGTGIKIIGYGGSNKGCARITIDGDEEIQDFYTEKDSPKLVLYTKSGLKFGKHSLKIEVLSKNRYEANNSYVYIDAIDVLDGVKTVNSDEDEYISNITDICDSTYVNEVYTLPKTVTASLNDGLTKAVAVTWDRTDIDTSRSGTIHITGTVKDYDKEVNLTLNILERHNSSTKYYTQISAVSGIGEMDSSHSLAVKSDGTVWAWGCNDEEQLGNSTSDIESVPVQVNGVKDVTEVSARKGCSFALKRDGTVWQWGKKNAIPTQIVGLSNIISISSGIDHTLALKNDGTVWAWGRNLDYGQLGDGTYINRDTPVQVKRINNIVAISAGAYNSLALDKNGQVWEWGMHINSDGCSSLPGNVMAGTKGGAFSDVIKISAGEEIAMAIKKDGTLWAWGGMYDYKVGDESNPYPKQVKGISDVTDISLNSNTLLDSALMLKKDGTVWGWGDNSYGQLGDGSTRFKNSVVEVNGLNNVKTILDDGYTCYAIKNDGTTLAWGSNQAGLLGNMNFKVDDNTTLLLKDVNHVYEEGYADKYAVKNDSSIWSIANGVFQMKNVSNIVSMAGVIALKDDGTIWDCRTTYKSNPVDNNEDESAYITDNQYAKQIQGIDDVKSINDKYALKNDGTVWCLNTEEYGRPLKGKDYVINQIEGLKDIVSMYVENNDALVVNKDGEVWEWTTSDSNVDDNGRYIISPKKVEGLSNVKSISMFDGEYIAIKNDGTVWEFGMAADKAPKELENINNAQSVYYSQYEDIFVVGKDGTVYECTWDMFPYAFKINGLSDVVQVIQPNVYKGYAVKKDGTVWCFGYRYSGKEDGQDTYTGFDPYEDTRFKDVAYLDENYCYCKNGEVIKLSDNREDVFNDSKVEFNFTLSDTERYENVKQIVLDDYDKFSDVLRQDGTLYNLDKRNNVNTSGISSVPVEVYCN